MRVFSASRKLIDHGFDLASNNQNLSILSCFVDAIICKTLTVTPNKLMLLRSIFYCQTCKPIRILKGSKWFCLPVKVRGCVKRLYIRWKSTETVETKPRSTYFGDHKN